ncbi:MAG: cation:proton antiporter [Anaerolineales bacterium]
MSAIFSVENYVIALLLVVAVVAIVVQRFNIPFTVALVVVGLVLGLARPAQAELTPDVILALFVPPLVFEAASNLHLHVLRKNMLMVGLLTVPGVVVAAPIVAGVVVWGAGLSWSAALVFGALIAATDPVAVVAVFRRLGLPERLTELIEGESLLNDGTAIVLYTLVLDLAVAGSGGVLAGFGAFVSVSVMGVGLGLLLGVGAAWIIARVDDYRIETTLTIVVAFGAYLLADRLHVSGVLAVVAAGLVVGQQSDRGMSPSTRLILFRFWDHAAFLANSLIFLLIGLTIHLPALVGAWRAIVWAIVAVLVSRAVIVYSLGWIGRISWRWRHVIVWGGLRGAISLALVLSLPLTLGPEREVLRLMAFGVVVFTLLVQATTIRGFARRLQLVRYTPAELEMQRKRAQRVSLQASEVHLKYLHAKGMISRAALEEVLPGLNEKLAAAEAEADMLEDAGSPFRSNGNLERRMVARELRRARTDALDELLRRGQISESVYTDVLQEFGE